MIATQPVQDSFFYKIAKPLIDLGIPVIPLRPRSKIAFLDSWQDIATTSEDQICLWSESYPDANCGAVAQAKLGGAWFWELDKPEVPQQYKADTGLKLPKTYSVRSRKDRGHFYFRHNELSLALLSNIAQNFVKGAGFSVRFDREYVVAASPLQGSIHPISGLPYEVVSNAPLIEADEVTIKWLLAQKLDQKSSGTTDPEQPIPEGKRDTTLASLAGAMRQRGCIAEEIEAVLTLTNQRRCVPPMDAADIHRIAFSIGRYQVKPTPPCIIGGRDVSDPSVQGPATVTSNEIDTTENKPRPVFPDWVMPNTSIYEGLVKPICEQNCRYPELVFMPALVTLMNYIGGRVYSEYNTSSPTVYLGLISPFGKFFKSSSAEDGFDYFKLAGLTDFASPHLKNADGKSLISSPGSPEGFELEMARLGCNNGIMYYDELGRFVKKAGIDGSSLTQSMLTIYESGLFQNLIKKKTESFSFKPRSYFFSWIWCTTDDAFPKYWSKLEAVSSGLNDRCFFLLSPVKELALTPRVNVDVSAGAATTKERITTAVRQQIFPVSHDDLQHFSKGISDPRSLSLFEKFALAFAVDLGLDAIDGECYERARALVDYRQQVMNMLPLFEADNELAAIQQSMVHVLQQNSGTMKYRDWTRKLNLNRKGTWLAGNAEQGLIKIGRIRTDQVKGNSKMIFLLKENE
ncbi:MAG: bifunctional DNA primase/polymerase [Ktedonobacteraceae bacterium]